MNAPPLLVSYSTVESYLSALSQDSVSSYQKEINDLVARGLPPVVNTKLLGLLFGLSNKFITSLLIDKKRHYRNFNLRKKGKVRTINAPKMSLKVIQKWFGSHLASSIDYASYVYGFIPGRKALDAAKVHCGSRWVYSIDIEDFFPSTPSELVYESLKSLGYTELGSKIITEICTLDGYLPQGAPSSPALSNLVAKNLDRHLYKLSTDLGVKYTRYADDIVFSGAEDFPKNLPEIIIEIFADTPWSLSERKNYFADTLLGHRLKVHGLLVKEDAVRLTKGYRNKIRAYKHLLEQGKIKDSDLQRIKGHLTYAKLIDNDSEL
ncbi:reverse transcriptase family protein [Kangiella aquimarina]|uniref:RNA-directed DNA polymerase n=1 Tax=Kangiella aquimarina TaxID=261965 RepID=A0ABZ0X177_9GAMM|nr:reverse transcriptase family protein [Kangiella aquimarina]WQG84149.1 reverse transcriptase family protein [Kangiella aquimarina]